jgi:hypothetical protein
VPESRQPSEPGPLSRRQRREQLSVCPHCGKNSATVRGVCTECWGSKGGRLFTVQKRGPESGPSLLSPRWGWSGPGCLPWVVLGWLLVLSIVTPWI